MNDHHANRIRRERRLNCSSVGELALMARSPESVPNVMRISAAREDKETQDDGTPQESSHARGLSISSVKRRAS